MKKILLISIIIFIIWIVPNSFATHISCGQNIINDSTLDSNLNCASGGSGVNIFNNSITFNCGSFSINGNYPDSGINLSNFNNVTIRDCRITSNRYGIKLLNATNSSIFNNSIRVNETGLLINNSVVNALFNNTVERTGLQNFSRDVLIENSQNINISHSNFRFVNGTEAVGIMLRSNVNNTIIFNNTIILNRQNSRGIHLLLNVRNSSIYNNVIMGLSSAGHSFFLNESTSSNNVFNNTINSDCGKSLIPNENVCTGILLLDNSSLDNVSMNWINVTDPSSAYGIYVYRFNTINPVDDLISNNTIYVNGSGIVIQEGTKINVTDNLIFPLVDASGISIVTSNYSFFINNSIIRDSKETGASTGTVGFGISNGATRNNLTRNTINVSSTGIQVSSQSAGGLVRDNFIYNNSLVYTGGRGIFVRNGAFNTTIINNFIRHVSNGIDVNTDVYGVIVGRNNFTANNSGASRISVQVQINSSNVNISENVFNSTGANTTFFSNSINISLFNNTFIGGLLQVVSINSNFTLILDQGINNYSFRNVSYLTIHNSSTANITFLGNISQDGLNLSFDIQINTINRSFINITLRPGFNVTANLSFFNISYNDPKPIFDANDTGIYIDCPTDRCGEYTTNIITNNLYRMNVTRWSVYAVRQNLFCGVNVTDSDSLAINLTCSASGLHIMNDNLFVNCAGFNMTGSGSLLGFNVTNRRNITIRDCNLFNFSTGIYSYNVTNSSYFNNTINNMSFSGLTYNFSSVFNNFFNNSIILSFTNAIGLLFDNQSSNNNITYNVINSSNGNATQILFNSNNTLLLNNSIINGLFGLVGRDLNDLILVEQSFSNFSLTNVTRLQIHNNTFGNVSFYYNITQNGLNFSNVIRISVVKLFVNTSSFLGFNVSSLINFFNVSFIFNQTNASVDFDDTGAFSVCSNCTVLLESLNIFRFNASHMTTYSIINNVPSTTTSDTGEKISDNVLLYVLLLVFSLLIIFYGEFTKNLILCLLGGFLLLISTFVGFETFTSPAEFNSILIVGMIGVFYMIKCGFQFFESSD